MKPAIFSSLRGYNGKRFISDLMSGVLIAIIALPLSIALGIQSGVTIQQGLLTAIVGGFFISVLSGSRYQIGGPTATFIAFSLSYIANPNIGLLGLQVAMVMAGVIMLIMAVFRVGGLFRFIPYPVVIGFTSGIGITLLAGQLKDFLGMKFTANSAGFVDKMQSIFTNLDTISWTTLALGLTTVAIILILQKVHKKIPASFIALIITTVITVILGQFDSNNYGIATINSTFGNIKPEFVLPDFAAIPNLNFAHLIMPALVITFLVSMESLLSCKVADGMTRKLTDTNAELMAQGTANIACALIGGIPATGVIARTAANIRNGAESSISGIIHAVILLVIFLVAMPLVGYVPMSSLAAVIIIVAINMTKMRQFGRLLRFNAKDFLILASSFLLTVIFDLVYGVVGGLVITFIVYMPNIFRHAQFTTIDSTYKAALNIQSDINDMAIVIVKLAGSINFINIHRLLKTINKAIAGRREIMLDFTQADSFDLSAAELLAKLTFKLELNDQRIMIFNPKASIMRQINLSRQVLV